MKGESFYVSLQCGFVHPYRWINGMFAYRKQVDMAQKEVIRSTFLDVNIIKLINSHVIQSGSDPDKF